MQVDTRETEIWPLHVNWNVLKRMVSGREIPYDEERYSLSDRFVSSVLPDL